MSFCWTGPVTQWLARYRSKRYRHGATPILEGPRKSPKPWDSPHRLAESWSQSGEKRIVTGGLFRASRHGSWSFHLFYFLQVCYPKFQCSNMFRGHKTLRTSILFTLVFSAWLGGNCHQHTLNPFWGENRMFLIWLNMRFAYLLAEGHALLGHDRMWSICLAFAFFLHRQRRNNLYSAVMPLKPYKGCLPFSLSQRDPFPLNSV